MTRKRSIIFVDILIGIFVAAALFFGWKLVRSHMEYRAGTQLYASVVNDAVQAAPPDGSNDRTQQVPLKILRQEEVPLSEQAAAFCVDFEALWEINQEIVGWIIGCDGKINYPVLQGSDNERYLTAMVNGAYNACGSVFMDFRNDAGLTDRNTFIYGHNMQNGAMFASLCDYTGQAYYEAHPELVLITPEGSWSLQVFSGYVTQGDSEIYRLDLEEEDEFSSYLELIRGKSNFRSEVPVTPQDQIITLSTCAYDYEDARFVLHCKPVRMQ